MTSALQIDAAELERHQRAVRANPRNAQAHALLGIALQQSGRLKEAVASQRRALELDPRLKGLHGVMALALHDLGDTAAAVKSYRKALAEQPNDADMHKGLSEALRQLGQLEEARRSAQRALELCPDDVDKHAVLASALQASGDKAAATAVLRRAIELAPERTDVLVDLANCLMNQSVYDEASALYRKVLEREPDSLYPLINLGACLVELRDLNGAETVLKRAHAISPDNPRILRDLGFLLQLLSKLAEARPLLERALQLSPDDVVVRSYLALNSFDSGQWDDALSHARHVLATGTELPMTESSMLFVLSHCCSDAVELTAAHRRFDERWEAPYRGKPVTHANPRDADRVLRVGFVSSDLNNHAVANFIEPVLSALKHSTQLELHAYYTHTLNDRTSARLREHFHQWHEVARVDDESLDRKIRADGIDILIDLSGHSARNRLGLFARKPAPVQASWIGYAGTTGLSAMDYYIADQFQVPEGRYDSQFTEKLVRLPLSAPFLPDQSAPPINALPALTNGYLTFGSFHRPNKLGRHVIALWSKLLRELPDSKMLLGGLMGGNEQQLVDWFAEEGIDKNRLLLRPRSNMQTYLAQHHEVDVCLSPFPYTGGTTVCHALWMGVPSLATIGPTVASHGTACYLAHLGLSSFIADDDENYLQLGRFLAENLPTLAALRSSMRERFLQCVVGYPGVTAAGLERAFRLMWLRWCEGQPAAPIRVTLAELSDG